MKKSTLTLSLSAVLAAGVIAASASAQSAGEASSALAMAPQTVKKGDADNAFVVAGKFSEPNGETMYRRVCAACHMPDAKGVSTGAGFFPALAGNKKLAASGYPLYVLTHGMNGMPPLGQQMSDQQVADVVNYVRTSFGNKYKDKVKPEDVKAVR
ncbi:cytochrome c [Novosphingobium flavum]|uniref:Cytochrome c n=1 Tax=Novosphingobium flavum TaxID=1778672 RepID=A0A7X1KMN6_9SPHN|nr:cytochrome c [Novosphingobium flavum]MBC2666824.1 cytochrome c [Novosphingobium flavum]